MLRGGSSSPMILLRVAAIEAVASGQQNAVHAPKFFTFLEQKTGLTADRIQVLFHPLNGWQVGINGSIVS